MEKDPRKKTLKIENLNFFLKGCIIMHIPRFDLVNSIMAQGIDFRMFIIMPYS